MTETTLSRRRRSPATRDRPPPGENRHEIANRVFFRLYQASNLMHRTGTRAVAAHGATTQQWAVMGALARPGHVQDGVSVKELMAHLCVSRQSLTVALRRLEGLGLVERVRPDADRRVRRVRLTRRGRAAWTRMQGAIRRYYEAALSEFSTRDAVALFDLLDRLTRRLGQL